MNILDALLIIVLLVCVGTDLKSRKIYNKVIFPSLLLTFGLHIYLHGFSGFTQGLLGFLVGLALLLIPYLMGGLGAGDVKLLALVGAVKGVSFVLMTAVYMALLGGVMALFILLFRKGVWHRLKSIVYYLSSLKQGMKVPLGIDKNDFQATYPYGVAIAGGAFVTLFMKGGIFPW
ncbi:A24 family peptidase [Rossellomorea aquimaris]|uniref:A24 family peptidase n=1 Tax=Rossellomorea aquimaris TaxID=189382 RepID=UPI0007D087B9|nr:prepilin peptidase [Rossellomorea aquimaris]